MSNQTDCPLNKEIIASLTCFWSTRSYPHRLYHYAKPNIPLGIYIVRDFTVGDLTAQLDESSRINIGWHSLSQAEPTSKPRMSID